MLEYYYNILSFIKSNDNDGKGFHLIPKPSLNIRYVRFDKRFLSTIYNDVYGTDINIKIFEKNFQHYIVRMFSVGRNKKTKNMLKRGYSISSVSTNGYSIDFLFEKNNLTSNNQINTKKMKKNKGNKKKPDEPIEKIDLSKLNPTNGLFEADECIASQEFLDKYNVIGIDPNNKNFVYGVSENNKRIKLSRACYNELSNITKGKVLMNNYLDKHMIKPIYEKLSAHDTKGVDKDKLKGYYNELSKNKDTLFNFYNKDKVKKISYETFIGKKHAIAKLIRKFIRNDGPAFEKYTNNFTTDTLNNNNKPILLFFGC